MKVILYMAMSINAFIARENDKEDFLSDINWNTFVQFAEKFGNVVIGRKTYETVKNWDESYNFDDLKNVKKIVVSRQSLDLENGYVLAKSPENALEILEKENFETALVMAGSTTNSSFAKLNLLDEIILNIEPVLLGKGKSLFSLDDFENRLILLENKTLDNGIVQLHYKIVK